MTLNIYYFITFAAGGYAFLWDNVQKLSLARDSSMDKKNSMLLWANAFAVKNCVDPDFGLDSNDVTLEAVDVPVAAYLPNAEHE